MNRAAARCWQACSPDKRPILSHRQMTHRQAPKTKQTCLGFGQGLPESRTLRTLSSSPTGGQVAVFRLFLVLVNQGLHPPVPVDSRSELMGRQAERGQWCLMRWPGKGTDGRGPGEGRGPWPGRAAAADGTTASDTGAAWCYYPERALFVSFRPTAPDFGGRSALGLTHCPPQRAVIYICPPPW